MNFKNIHIGQMIEKRVQEMQIDRKRLCNFFKLTEEEIINTFRADNIDSDLLLKWSKILEYDFFRLYSQHLILYSPAAAVQSPGKSKIKTGLPQFRKNIYTQESYRLLF